MSTVADVIDQASSRPRRPQRQPTFSKLTLPPEYDQLNLVTRLWLQSRLIKPQERKEKEEERERRRQEKRHEREARAANKQTTNLKDDSEKALLDDRYPVSSGASTPVTDSSSTSASTTITVATSVDDAADELAVSTDVKVDDVAIFRAPGTSRPVKLSEIWIWLDLCRELSPYLGKAAKHAHPLRLLLYFLEQVSDRLDSTIQ